MPIAPLQTELNATKAQIVIALQEELTQNTANTAKAIEVGERAVWSVSSTSGY